MVHPAFAERQQSLDAFERFVLPTSVRILKPDDILENVDFSDNPISCGCPDYRIDPGKGLKCRHVLLQFVVQAALKSAALTAETRRIQWQILQLGR